MRPTVLLVDDDPRVLDGLTRVLHREPYRLLRAGSADEAAAILEREPVDVIVCDEQMPGMCGTEFLARVARNYPEVVRIVLTGEPSLEVALRAINEGRVARFFTKPCNEIDLALTIREALERRSAGGVIPSGPTPRTDPPPLTSEARILRRLRGGAPAGPGA